MCYTASPRAWFTLHPMLELRHSWVSVPPCWVSASSSGILQVSIWGSCPEPGRTTEGSRGWLPGVVQAVHDALAGGRIVIQSQWVPQRMG